MADARGRDPGMAAVERLYGLFAARDLDGVAMALAPDFELDLSGHLLDEGVHRGWDEVRAYVASLAKTWEAFAIDLEHLIGGGETVVALTRTRGVGHGSGISVEERIAHVWTLRDGMATRLQVMSDREEALRMAGLAGQ